MLKFCPNCNSKLFQTSDGYKCRTCDGYTPPEKKSTSKPTSYTLTSDTLPKTGDEFTEKQLYEKFHVRNSGGIRPTTRHKAIILINSFFSEHQGGYKDHVDENEGFVYLVGEGEDTQELVRNNKSVLESKSNGYSLLYFEKPIIDKLIFRHLLEYDSWTRENQVNSKGTERQVIVFKLKIIS